VRALDADQPAPLVAERAQLVARHAATEEVDQLTVDCLGPADS
jgi:hypothetical protein